MWNDVITRNNDNGGTGSGCSKLVAKPVWQTDKGCTMRSETDISAVADPDTPVAVYDSFPSGGWGAYGGTSVSSPLIAGVFALAGNSAAIAQPARDLVSQGGVSQRRDDRKQSRTVVGQSQDRRVSAGVGIYLLRGCRLRWPDRLGNSERRRSLLVRSLSAHASFAAARAAANEAMKGALRCAG